MAKKTKSETQELVKEDTSKIDVSSNSNVKITLMKNGLVVKTINKKNSAKEFMLLGIAHFLKGSFLFDSNQADEYHYVPRFLGVGTDGEVNNSVNHGFSSKTLGSEINVGTRFDVTATETLIKSTDKTVQIVLTALIPGKDIAGRIIKELGLFSSYACNDATLLARVVEPEGIEVPGDYSIYVEWVIGLTNS